MKRNAAEVFPSFDGIKVLCHAGMVASHVAMIATVYLASEGEVYKHWIQTSAYKLIMLGGMGIDLMWVICGFLTANSFINYMFNDEITFTLLLKRIASRWFRFQCLYLPLYLYWCFFTDYLKQQYNPSTPLWQTLVVTIAFVKNSFPQTMGTYDGPLWSVFGEFQYFVLIGTLITTTAYVIKHPATRIILILAEMVLLVVVSLSERERNFDTELNNLAKLEPLFHVSSFRNCTNPHIAIRDSFGVPLTQPSVCHEALGSYMIHLHIPTLVRLSAPAIGAILRCVYHVIGKRTTEKQTNSFWNTSKRIFSFFLIVMVSVFILMIMFSSSANLLEKQEKDLTIYFHFVVSVLVSYLLFCVVVPEGHAMRLDRVSRFLSMRFWSVVSSGLYASLIIHYYIVHLFLSIYPPHVKFDEYPPAEASQLFLFYIVKIFIAVISVSLLSGFVIHNLIEEPLLKIFSKILFSSNIPKAHAK